jgi:hypothetical protein
MKIGDLMGVKRGASRTTTDGLSGLTDKVSSLTQQFGGALASSMRQARALLNARSVQAELSALVNEVQNALEAGDYQYVETKLERALLRVNEIVTDLEKR